MRQQYRIRQPRAAVVGGIARDGQRLGDGVPYRGGREIGGAGVAAAQADIDGDADALVAVVGDGLDVPLAHGNALAEGLRDLGLGRGRAARARSVQHLCGDVGERAGGERKTILGRAH